MDMNRSAYYKAETKLSQKKEELFRHGNVSKWEILPEELKNIDKNEISKNKEYAFSKMLGKVNNFFFNRRKHNMYIF